MVRPFCLLLVGALGGCASMGAAGDAVAPPPHDPRLRASDPVAPSPVAVPLDAAALAGLPREQVRAHAHGQALDCEGVALAALLRRA
ncbi:MAG TPA: hypothetical protein VHF86_00560, partial [Xanthomonadaceae bacterium]|nr:hypothetical protein [Xanthomonadaceae bacterium]